MSGAGEGQNAKGTWTQPLSTIHQHARDRWATTLQRPFTTLLGALFPRCTLTEVAVASGSGYRFFGLPQELRNHFLAFGIVTKVYTMLNFAFVPSPTVVATHKLTPSVLVCEF